MAVASSLAPEVFLCKLSHALEGHPGSKTVAADTIIVGDRDVKEGTIWDLIPSCDHSYIGARSRVLG